MADHTLDTTGNSHGVGSDVVRRAQRSPFQAQGFVLAPGEAAASPPNEPPHWNLRLRVGLLVGMAALSWAIVGGVVLLLIRR